MSYSNFLEHLLPDLCSREVLESINKRETMNSAEYIKGPWQYQEQSDAYTHIVRGAGGSEWVCQLSQDTTGKAEARARLIAAAPDLLKALQQFMGYYESDFFKFTAEDGRTKAEWVGLASKAIAKATGTLSSDLERKEL